MATEERLAQLRRICEQVDYYMSPSNLARDVFLVGLMDMHFFVPLVFIATFPRVRSITPDIPTLIEAMRLSTKCELDSSMSCIRPSNWNFLTKYPSEKGFLIVVREVPSSSDAPETPAAPASNAEPTEPPTRAEDGAPPGPSFPPSPAVMPGFAGAFSPFYVPTIITAPLSTVNYLFPPKHVSSGTDGSAGTPRGKQDTRVVTQASIRDLLDRDGIIDDPSVVYDLRLYRLLVSLRLARYFAPLRLTTTDQLRAFSRADWARYDIPVGVSMRILEACHRRHSTSSKS